MKSRPARPIDWHANPLYYLHIHKTAGTTMRAVLDAAFPGRKTCPILQFEDLGYLPKHRLDRYLYYRGHHGHLLPELLSRPCTIVTTLREPAKRLLSHYHHLRREPQYFDSRTRAAIEGRSMGLLDLLRDETTRGLFWNLQTCQIGLDYDVEPIRRELAEIHERGTPRRLRSVEFLRVMAEAHEHVDGEALLRRAMQRLDSFAAVGLVEDYPNTVRVLSHRLGLLLPLVQERKNVRPAAGDRDELTDEVREAIDQHCTLDRRLYEHGRKLFQEQLAEIERDGGNGARIESHFVRWKRMLMP